MVSLLFSIYLRVGSRIIFRTLGLVGQQRGGAVKALSPKARPFCDRQVVPTEGGLRGSLLHAVPVP